MSGLSESPIKHSSGGEMPDASLLGQLGRRVQGITPILSEELKRPLLLIPLLAVGIGASAYFIYQRFFSGSSESQLEI